MTDHDGKTTTDTIRQWAESRGGRPARVADTGREGGILRIDFQEPEEGVEGIDWETFFRVFEDRRLAFLYQDETADGCTRRFNKFVSRD